MLLVLLTAVVAGSDAGERLARQTAEIAQKQASVDLLARARQHLLARNASEVVEALPRRLLIREEVTVDPILSRFLQKSAFSTVRNITALEVLHLKPVGSYRDSANALNLVVAVGFSDGVVELVDVQGELVYRYDTGHNGPVRLMAATNNYEEIKFVTLSTDKLLRVHSLDMSISKKNYTVETAYWGQQTSKALLTLTTESICPLFCDSQLDLKTMQPIGSSPLYNDDQAQATSVLFYVRSGVKYWLVGDSLGGISLHHFNGTFLRRGETQRAPIAALDRFGQHVVFGSGRTVGTFLVPQMSVYTYCEEHSSAVTDVLIDISTSTSIVFASYSNGDLLAHDTRFTVNGENVCRTVARLREKEASAPLKLGGFKGGVAVWGSNGALAFFNSVLQTGESGGRNTCVNFAGASSALLFKSMRMTTGGYLMTFAPNANTVYIYESLPSFHVGTSPSEFGNSRMLLIGGIVAVAVGYQICKRGSSRKALKPRKWK